MNFFSVVLYLGIALLIAMAVVLAVAAITFIVVAFQPTFPVGFLQS